MAGKLELGFPRQGTGSLKEQLARTTLNNVRSNGHPYVELRGNGKRFVYFCTLCVAPCYGESVLFDHLRGSVHNERLSAAKVTLLKENPWPFSDGVFFFDWKVGSGENENEKCGIRESDADCGGDSLAIVKSGEGCRIVGNGRIGSEKDLSRDLVIPHVLIKDEVSDLKVRFVGSGRIAARFWEKGTEVNEISRIWCEWLGDNACYEEDEVKVLDHDYAIVTFSYSYDLGSGLVDDLKLLLTAGSQSEVEDGDGCGKKIKRSSFSDPEDMSESNKQYGSSGGESPSSTGASSTSLLDRYDDQLAHTRFISNKMVRRELRRQQRLAAERMCAICQQKMIPEKDVAALVNVKTGKLACSSRNVNGAFHVFHVSCLINWILLCEMEMNEHQSVSLKVIRRSKRKNGITKSRKIVKDGKMQIIKTRIDSVFCPDCQGTGLNIEGEDFEMPTFPLSEMFKFKMKVSDGRRGWMKSPEVLKNCSTGFHFASESEGNTQEKVLPLKLLHFYRADEQLWTRVAI